MKVIILLVLASAACLPGGCKCSRDVAVSEGPPIDTPPLAQENPDAPRPEVSFPARLHQPDETLNRFIEQALEVCSRGDYDAFRQLFGTAHEPTSQADFTRVWHDVDRLLVEVVEKAPEPPERYFVVVKVDLRNPDRKGRRTRIAPLVMFREGSNWRLGPGPREFTERLQATASRPVSTQAK